MEKKKINKILLLGSGALKIGEAGEFDYSGSQAAKATIEEGIKTIIINPNIATIQTSQGFADKIYFLPLTPYFVEKVIKKEKPDAILLGFGGQTALNCGLELSEKGTLHKNNVQILGTPISAVRKTEDRLLFRKCIEELDLKVPQSITCTLLSEVKKLKGSIQFPVIIRAGFALGGLGSGVARNFDQLLAISQKALGLSPQILIEEYLEHWKEIEYEVVRDRFDNTITVCNMENFDPMGIHTGESIVVAPSQTLTNAEYHNLREIAIKVVKSLPIIGECNIQYALNPKNGDYRIIEVNARLSRSSALASKATGYPLAYVATKLALGYGLHEIPNQVTRVTTSFFEPALDYVVVKIPRWDFLKFKKSQELLGSQMQSVGEVMAIGRSFEEALQKAIRSLALDYEGVISEELENVSTTRKQSALKSLLPTPDRIYNIAHNLYFNQPVETIHRKTGIDWWFLRGIEKITSAYKLLQGISTKNKLSKDLLYSAKKLGFSDVQIGKLLKISWEEIRKIRKKYEITPKICQIDTTSGEFPAKTNYLYLSYHREQNDTLVKGKKQVGVIGGGPYQIGSSVEFDWCAVNTVLTAKKLGFSPIMINCNPETVSTDYDISDKLYFEELTLERILDIVDIEKCPLILSVGGQVPNNLAKPLSRNGVKLLGTQAEMIDKAEDRQKFSNLLDKLSILQPPWSKIEDREKAKQFAQKIGYPVLIRPSYVLSGRAMFIAYSQKMLETQLSKTVALINKDFPLVISKFIKGAKEVDFDGVADNGSLIAWAISEHVEHAGVHSGDATLILPSFSLKQEDIDAINIASQKIIEALCVTGPFNIQFLVKRDSKTQNVLVIEANIRASRSFPFVSKVLGVNFIDVAAKIMLGQHTKVGKILKPKYFAVKVPHFSFTRLKQVDPVLGVEMASTGEVASFGEDIFDAYLKAILSTGMKFPQSSALLSLGGEEGKTRVLPAAKILQQILNFQLYATEKTAKFLKENGIKVTEVFKVHEGKRPNVVDLIKDKKVDLVINIIDKNDLGLEVFTKQETDGYLIRRASVDTNIPLFTKATIANLLVESLKRYKMDMLTIKPLNEYVTNIKLDKEKS